MSEVGIKATKESLAEIVKAEPKKYAEAELGRILGVSRQRVHDIVNRLNLHQLVRPKQWNFYCIDCGKPIHYGATRCWQCWLKIYGVKRLTLSCDFCGKQFEKKESEARRHKFHFCSTNCRNSYGAIYKWTKSAKMVTLTCDFCGKQFERKESEARSHKWHFCSRSCSRNYARDYGFGGGKARAGGLPLPEPSRASLELRTKVFELYNDEYSSLVELARAMGISNSQIYRVKHGKRAINEKFIIGALKAFPRYELGDLFYVVPDGSDQVKTIGS